MSNNEKTELRCGCGGAVDIIYEDWCRCRCDLCETSTDECLTEEEAIEAFKKATRADEVERLLKQLDKVTKLNCKLAAKEGAYLDEISDLEQENQQLLKQLKSAMTMLSSAGCPNKCHHGVVVTTPGGESQPCDWCEQMGCISEAIEKAEGK